MSSEGDFGSYCFISDVKRVIKFEPSFGCDKNEISSSFLPKYSPIEKLFSQINIWHWLGGKLSIISALDTCVVPIFIISAKDSWPVLCGIFVIIAKYNTIPAEFPVEI